MILHLGSDVFVPLDAVVAVLSVTGSGCLAQELSSPALNGFQVEHVGAGMVKSVVVTVSGDRRVLFLSPISARTLARRAGSGTA